MSGQPDTRARVERPRTLTNGWTSRSPSPGEITARTVKKAETMSRIVELEKPDRAAGALSPASPTARRATRAHGLVSRPRPGSGPPLGRGARASMAMVPVESRSAVSVPAAPASAAFRTIGRVPSTCCRLARPGIPLEIAVCGLGRWPGSSSRWLDQGSYHGD